MITAQWVYLRHAAQYTLLVIAQTSFFWPLPLHLPGYVLCKIRADMMTAGWGVAFAPGDGMSFWIWQHTQVDSWLFSSSMRNGGAPGGTSCGCLPRSSGSIYYPQPPPRSITLQNGVAAAAAGALLLADAWRRPCAHGRRPRRLLPLPLPLVPRLHLQSRGRQPFPPPCR